MSNTWMAAVYAEGAKETCNLKIFQLTAKSVIHSFKSVLSHNYVFKEASLLGIGNKNIFVDLTFHVGRR